MKNGQWVHCDALTEEEKKMVEIKKIQHYIPCRTVFKDSLSSTICRPVFGESTNTKPNLDGSEGDRCTNYLLVKGRVVTPNLVKMMPRFMVGTEACPEQWNLQSVYLRHELDPGGTREQLEVSDDVVDKERDGVARRVSIQYQNANEDFSRATDRVACSIVKLMNINDTTWLDLEEDKKLIAVLLDDEAKDETYIMSKANERNVGVHRKPSCTVVARPKFMKPCRRCSCISHCLFFKHSNENVMVNVGSTSIQKVKFVDMLDRSWLDTETYEEKIFDIDRHDPFMSLLCATNLDLNDGASATGLCVSLHQTVLVVAFCRLTPNSR